MPYAVQPLWANSEKLVALMSRESRTLALGDLQQAKDSALGAYGVRVADEMRLHFEPIAEFCSSPEDVIDVLPGHLFVYSGAKMYCKGMHFPRDAKESDSCGRIRIGSPSSPSMCEGPARLAHSLVHSVDSLSLTGSPKYLMGARSDANAFIPLIAGITVLDFEDVSPTHAPRYPRLRRDTPLDAADQSIETFRHEVETGNTWRLFESAADVAASSERQFQLAFELVCNVISKDFDVSVDPQANHGSGTVDVCFSSGANDACCVELKVSSHKNLRHGLEKQLPEYMRSKGTQHGRFVVLCTDRGLSPEDVQARLAGVSPVPNLTIRTVVIDARPRKSASRV